MDWNTPVTKIKGVGEVTAKRFKNLGVETAGELLRHFPKGYEEYQMPIPCNRVRPDSLVSVELTLVKSPKMFKKGRFEILSAEGKDHTGYVELVWFNQPYLKQKLVLGKHLIFRGKITKEYGKLKMTQPEIYEKEKYLPMLRCLRPIYSLTAGLNQKTVQKSVEAVLTSIDVPDLVPQGIRREYKLMKLSEAYRAIHFPEDSDITKEAIRRLAFDEFFTFLLTMRGLKSAMAVVPNCHVLKKHELSDRVRASFPFELTEGQQTAMKDIFHDLSGCTPMNRLLQGDVGSGKTAVAILSLVAMVENGSQGVLMAPTEVLAQQHFQSISELLIPFGIRVGLLVGSMTASQKREMRKMAETGDVDIVIGTHALFQDEVHFHKLGLAIVDEQHRFGVKQREQLASKGESVHVLIMSATPIPRTLAVMLYGDMDLTILSELPKNRIPIKSCLVDPSYHPTAYRFLKKHIQAGEQAYVICPMVEDSETVEAENVVEYTEKLRAALAGIPSENGSDSEREPVVEYVHGKLSAAEKNARMTAFSEGKIDILVSTTVVEVGINVPNATVIMIENAERFGLSSLHQLRGRVGRGSLQSYCILVQGKESEETKERLGALVKSNDGFFLAEEDLRLRGPGDFFGIRQSGDMDFAIADIVRDKEMLVNAKQAVEHLSEEECERLTQELVAIQGVSMVY